MKLAINSTILKSVLTIVAFTLVGASGIPPLAPFSFWLTPIGTAILGALHIDTKAVA